MPQRDVYNPLLFEIAWEVANKGTFFIVTIIALYKEEADMTMNHSGRHLYRYQNQGSCDGT